MTGLPLVTGAAGFAGSHLVDHLLERAPAVGGWYNPAAPAPARANVEWRGVGLLDRAAVAAALRDSGRAAIFHLAGEADLGQSWNDPARALRVNAVGTHYLLDAVAEAGLTCPVLVTCSAAVYRPSLEALTEDAPIGPSSPYGLSKLAQELVARGPGPGRVIVTRPFNHAGPRQSAAYVTSAFARQIAAIEAGRLEPVLRVGNLDARRDVSDVRDVVRAYALLLERGRDRQPYNVCSGQAFRIGDLLEFLLSLARVPIDVRQDPARLRPSDTPVVLGSPAALARDTGWAPSHEIRDTLRDLLEYWRSAPAS
jgi:GDP-4-dehydro-6-deoxy-D-mannose reductase